MATNVIPGYESFDPDEEASALPQKWDEWLDGLETLFMGQALTDQQKWALLRYYGGAKLRNLERQLDYDKTQKYDEVEDHYRRLKEALTAHFAPSKNTTYEEYTFNCMTQEDSETIDAYVTRLRRQAKLCGFCDKTCTDRAIRNRIVIGGHSSRLRRKALEKDYQLSELISIAKEEEKASSDVDKIEKNEKTNEPTADMFKTTKCPGKYSTRGKMPNSYGSQQQSSSRNSSNSYGSQISNNSHMQSGSPNPPNG